MSDERLHLLLEKYFDGALTASELAELESRLRNSAEARAEFWDEAEWQAMFRDWAAQEGPRAEAQRSAPSATRSASRRASRPATSATRSTPSRGWVWAITCLIAFGALAYWQWTRPTPRPVQELATVEAVSNVAIAPGVKIKTGSFTLSGGVAQLRFSGGATVVVQGPAQLELIGANEITLRRGRILVDAAGGFIVGTPEGRVRDLGTRFGVAVLGSAQAEAHVFEGRVEMAGETMQAGQALVVTSGRPARAAADATLFPQPQRIIGARLAGGDFEPGSPISARGIPTKPGEWSGDRCEIVGSLPGFRPQSGAGMLRFLDNPPGPTDDAAELWQFVDLSPYREALAAGGQVELSAWFNRESAPGDARPFTMVLAAYRGSIEQIRTTLWPQRPAMTLDYEATPVVGDDDPTTWQQGKAGISIPPDADWLLVSIAAHRGNPPRGLPSRFADSVVLRITLPPRPAANPR